MGCNVLCPNDAPSRLRVHPSDSSSSFRLQPRQAVDFVVAACPHRRRLAMQAAEAETRLRIPNSTPAEARKLSIVLTSLRAWGCADVEC